MFLYSWDHSVEEIEGFPRKWIDGASRHPWVSQLPLEGRLQPSMPFLERAQGRSMQHIFCSNVSFESERCLSFNQRCFFQLWDMKARQENQSMSMNERTKYWYCNRWRNPGSLLVNYTGWISALGTRADPSFHEWMWSDGLTICQKCLLLWVIQHFMRLSCTLSCVFLVAFDMKPMLEYNNRGTPWPFV